MATAAAHTATGSPRGRQHEVAIIGGGLSGLAAAAALQRAGVTPTIVEAESALGGKAQTLHVDGHTIERGPLGWSGRRADVWWLLDALGLSDAAIPVDAATTWRFLVRDGALCELRPSPLSLLSTRALRFGERLRLAREPFVREPAAAVADDESVASFLRRRFGASFTTHVAAAALAGIYAGDLETLSARACLPSLVALAAQHGSVLRGVWHERRAPKPGKPGTFRLRGGFSSLAARAAERFETRTSTRVEAIAQVGSGWHMHTAGGDVIAARALIIALDAPAASKLCLRSTDTTRALASLGEALADFSYAPLTLVHWRERSSGSAKLPRGFGSLAAPSERRFVLGALHVSDVIGEGDDRRRFTSFIGGALGAANAALPDAELIARTGADLRSLTGGTLGQVLHIQRWPQAIAQPLVGHAARVGRARDLAHGLGLGLCGSYLAGAAMHDAIASGRAAAAQALELLAANKEVAHG